MYGSVAEWFRRGVRKTPRQVFDSLHSLNGGVAEWLRRGTASPEYVGSNPAATSNQKPET